MASTFMDTNWEYHYDNCVQRYCLPRGVAQRGCENEISHSQNVVRPHLINYIWLILTAADYPNRTVETTLLAQF